MDEPDDTAIPSLAISDLMQKPILSLEEACAVMGLPLSTFMEILDAHPAPIFLLGRRRKIFTEDLCKWLREVAASNQWTARINNRSKRR